MLWVGGLLKTTEKTKNMYKTAVNHLQNTGNLVKYVINTCKSQEKVCKIRENTCVRLHRVWGGTGKQIITILETCKIYE